MGWGDEEVLTMVSLAELLREGENSCVEFKRDDVQPHDLAKELKDVMRDYGYLEHMGLGIPRKIVRGMQEFNGSKPKFVVGEESLTVVLRREPE